MQVLRQFFQPAGLQNGCVFFVGIGGLGVCIAAAAVRRGDLVGRADVLGIHPQFPQIVAGIRAEARRHNLSVHALALPADDRIVFPAIRPTDNFKAGYIVDVVAKIAVVPGALRAVYALVDLESLCTRIRRKHLPKAQP